MKGGYKVKIRGTTNLEDVRLSADEGADFFGTVAEVDLDTLNMIHGALQGGARGVVMGRNVWRSPHPTALLSAVYGLIHENMNVRESAGLLERKIAEWV